MTDRRALHAIAAGLIAIALWSIIGVVVALYLDAIDVAWKFLLALAGSGATLILVNLFEARLDG